MVFLFKMFPMQVQKFASLYWNEYGKNNSIFFICKLIFTKFIFLWITILATIIPHLNTTVYNYKIFGNSYAIGVFVITPNLALHYLLFGLIVFIKAISANHKGHKAIKRNQKF